MDEMALKKVECPKSQETYNVEKVKVSEMVVLLNGVEYSRKEDLLYRKNENEGYKVKLHFQENNTDVISCLQKILKETYMELNYKEM